jgi:hypothetical protein
MSGVPGSPAGKVDAPHLWLGLASFTEETRMVPRPRRRDRGADAAHAAQAARLPELRNSTTAKLWRQWAQEALKENGDRT